LPLILAASRSNHSQELSVSHIILIEQKWVGVLPQDFERSLWRTLINAIRVRLNINMMRIDFKLWLPDWLTFPDSIQLYQV
jgi:hypothetical protein